MHSSRGGFRCTPQGRANNVASPHRKRNAVRKLCHESKGFSNTPRRAKDRVVIAQRVGAGPRGITDNCLPRRMGASVQPCTSMSKSAHVSGQGEVSDPGTQQIAAGSVDGAYAGVRSGW